MPRSGIMLCNQYNERRLQTWEPPILIQPKINGFRCRATVDSANLISLWSSQGNLTTSVPHINKELSQIYIRNIEFDGELFAPHLTFEEIQSIVKRTRNIHSRHQEIEYHIFDVVDETISQKLRTELLFDLFYPRITKVKRIKIVKTYSVGGPWEYIHERIQKIFTEITSESYEGIVLRKSQGMYERKKSLNLMKLKPTETGMFRIVGSAEEISIHGIPKNSLGAFQCITQEGEIFSVGSGFIARQRVEYWGERDDMIDKSIIVVYQNITTRGVPMFPRFKALIN